MKLALVTETFPPEVNGVAMTLRRLTEGLCARGDEVMVVRPRQRADRNGAGHAGPARPYSEWLVPGVALPRYEGLMMGLPVSGRLAAGWSRARPDIVHIATEGPLGWSALGAAAKLGLPVSSSFHTNFHQYGKHYGFGAAREVAIAYLRAFHNQTGITLVPTRQMRDQLARDGFRNLDVLSRGVDAELFGAHRRSEELRRSWGAAPDDPVCIYVGRLAREKNIALAVDAYLAVRERLPRARFVLVGDGPEGPALKRRHPEFHFAGMRLGADLGAHYASGDIFLFPSTTETFGNVVTEALGSGLVVVTYDYAAGREHIRSGENGVLAPFDDAAAFRASAAGIAARPEAWPAIRAAARATAMGVTWGAIVERFRAQLDGVRRAHAGAESGV